MAEVNHKGSQRISKSSQQTLTSCDQQKFHFAGGPMTV